ncbi:RNA polymerase subunit Rpb4/RPC9 [Dillenia turbinata]|uniref:RNA polymerase subunit Rpb4/RPC9 n=1 Tax=Dillenia turbinata TaxID=194707 RepID=A0AAN8VEQ6_9MAGN
MSEKGGKGYSAPKAPKSALKTSQVSSKGKDDSSAKSKRGRKVQFDNEGTPEVNSRNFSDFGGKFETLSSKGDFGKAGKGGKTMGEGKSAMLKDRSKLELRIENELPKNAKCLMDCEAADILQGIQEQMVLLSEDPTIKIPAPFDRGLQYAKRGNHYSDPQSLRRVLDNLTKYGASDGEICMIANICPETVDEVFALVPSLKKKESKLKEPLKNALSELAKLKDST